MSRKAPSDPTRAVRKAAPAKPSARGVKAAPAAARQTRADPAIIRGQIKKAAEALFIQHGLIKMTLAMVAEQLDMSRPTVHYYYRTKSSLAEAVLEDYAKVSVQASQQNWLDPEASLDAKFEKSLQGARLRYQRYNPGGRGDRPWSLFARFYQELDLMTPAMGALIKSVAREQEAYYAAAINIAKARKELLPSAPSAGLSIQIVSMLHQVGWLTWAHGDFDAVQTAYETTLAGIKRAWGNERARH
ncbi:MAG: helix-turn-helix domain-containing protein [Burkholderiaceae bacterium]|nr:helix-turn-helix domain-containing protein [Burkholderiaceae bacterium]